MRYLITLFAFISIINLSAQESSWQGVGIDFKNGPLQVSANGRYLQHKNGTPFFYLGDTAWELFHRLTDEEIEEYLEDRRAKGFTVIQAVLIPELDGLNVPNMYGHLPLKDIHEIIPDEAYFKWVDKVIRMAETKGLFMALLPTWGDKVDKQWGKGPEIFTAAYAQAYTAWLGKRYKNFKNIIWVVGGDRWGGDGNYPIWDAFGKGFKSTDKNHLVTFHPPGAASSGQWFNNCKWLDFNMLQTGHCSTDYEIYDQLLIKDYNREIVKPVMDGEPRYENHPICNDPSKGWFDDTDVRNAMYWSLFSGAFGHTYGCHDIWQMKTPEREPVGDARGDWRSSLDLPGAQQVIFARRLLENLDWETREPAQGIITSENSSMQNKIVALKGDGYALIYFPHGEKATVNLSEVGNRNDLDIEWMNPRTGELTTFGCVEREKPFEVTPPSSGRGNDWIMIVKE